MITITAVIRAKPGREAVVEGALASVIADVKANEPGTIAYFVSRAINDPCVFTTFERFVDEAAMNSHNQSAAVAAFITSTEGALDGPIVLHACEELDFKPF